MGVNPSQAKTLGRPAGRLGQNMGKGKADSFEVRFLKKIAYFLAGFRKILYLCIKDAKPMGKSRISRLWSSLKDTRKRLKGRGSFFTFQNLL